MMAMICYSAVVLPGHIRTVVIQRHLALLLYATLTLHMSLQYTLHTIHCDDIYTYNREELTLVYC
jgi:hypothetical protein